MACIFEANSADLAWQAGHRAFEEFPDQPVAQAEHRVGVREDETVLRAAFLLGWRAAREGVPSQLRVGVRAPY